MRPLLTVLLVLGCQALVYGLAVHRFIVGWGASVAERRMPLLGDRPGPVLARATRAITIDAPRPQVWRWLVQLGADRGGFFSYAWIETVLGYEAHGTGPGARFDMPVGRVVPASRPGARPLVRYDFPVLAVDPGRTFVLGGWGTFHLEELGAGRTRLIVRTQGVPPSGPLSRVVALVWTVMHYVMERRMLLGVKARAEAGEGPRPSDVPDAVWLGGVALSGVGVALVALLGTPVLGAVLAVGAGLAWVLVLLVLPPRPAYALGLVLLVAAALVAG